MTNATTHTPQPSASDEVRLFVGLQVKPEKFAAYAQAMRAEAAGARSEPGNLGFDMFVAEGDAHTLYLLEHWASRAALEVDHARQPYYIHVRGMEAECLTGEVEERRMQELAPRQPLPPGHAKSLGRGDIRAVTLTASDPRAFAALDAAFVDAAAALRGAGGNRALVLFRNLDNPGERLLIEAWDSHDARARAWSLATAQTLRTLLDAPAQSGRSVLVLRNHDHAPAGGH